MKTKKSLLLMAALMLCQFSYGQFIKEVKVGASLVHMQFKNPSLNEMSSGRLGYFAGIAAQQELGEKLFLRQELVYANKGNVHKPVFAENESRNNLHYLTLPLLTGYKLTPKLSAYAGPELALVGAVIVYNDGHRNNLRDWEDYNKFDIGASAGLMYQLTSRVAMDLRYTHGFRKVRHTVVRNASGQYSEPTHDGKNRVLQLGVNYSFRKR